MDQLTNHMYAPCSGRDAHEDLQSAISVCFCACIGRHACYPSGCTRQRETDRQAAQERCCLAHDSSCVAPRAFKLAKRTARQLVRGAGRRGLCSRPPATACARWSATCPSSPTSAGPPLTPPLPLLPPSGARTACLRQQAPQQAPALLAAAPSLPSPRGVKLSSRAHAQPTTLILHETGRGCTAASNSYVLNLVPDKTRLTSCSVRSG